MKKTLLCLVALAATVAGRAQTTLTLSGTSYFQSFDNAGSGLPTGWEIDSAASPTSRGYALQFDATSSTQWISPSTATGKGKNFAAKAGFTINNTPAATQSAATNRAMGVRQVGSVDSQIAFTLTLAQTAGLTNFNLVFNLQSLDSSSPRISTWAVQYGLGLNPTSFTTVTASGSNGLTTGNAFTNSVVTASFGAALNNQSGPVVIRIINPNKTTGSGNRASTGVDSLTLSWTGSAVNNVPSVTALSPANNATSVAVSSTLSVTFDKAVTAGPGNIYIRNATDGTMVTKAATSADVTISGMTATIANAGLLNGKRYQIQFDSTAFKNGTTSAAGIYDTTQWRFTTVNQVGIASVHLNAVSVTVLGEATTNGLTAAFTAPTAGSYTVALFDLSGREVARQIVRAAAGANTAVVLQASLQAGLYTVRVSNGEAYGVAKTAVH